MSLLHHAAEAWSCGRYEECERRLQQVQMQSFSRLQWSLEYNRLVCRMQKALAAGLWEELGDVSQQLTTLWDKVRGLPPREESITAELCIACAQCQLYLAQRAQGYAATSDKALQCCEVVVGRICRCVGAPEEPFAQVVPVLRMQPQFGNGSFAAKCLLKLAFLKGLVHLVAGTAAATASEVLQCTGISINEEENITSPFDQAVHAKCLQENEHGDIVEPAATREMKYHEAWQLYKQGSYQEALRVLQPVLSSKDPSLCAVGRLLAGACYSNMGKPNLALCNYQHCLSSPSNVAVLPALHNCVTVYRTIGNTEAEMDMRELLLKALRIQQEQLNPRIDNPEMLLWKTDHHNSTAFSPDPPRSSQLQYLVASYHSAHRALQLCRYKDAAGLLEEILENGRDPLPPASILHLQCVRTLLCCGEPEKAELLCSKLVEAFLPSSLEGQGEDVEVFRHYLVLIQTLYLRALAAVNLGRITTAQQYCERCLKLVRILLARLEGNEHKEMLVFVKKLQVYSLNMLAVVMVGISQPERSLCLLRECVAVGDSPPPTGVVFNFCLLQGKVGQVGEASLSWLQHRDLLPSSLQEGRRRITEARQRAGRLTAQEEVPNRYYLVMDVAMLSVWLRCLR